MVEDLGYGGSQLGIYAGGLAASFCAAQFCSSIMWGVLSDKYGRKPTIFIGTLGAVGGMIIFGCATTYVQALLGRIISGFLSGNLGVLKSFLTEITDDSNRAAGFSYMSVAWALGTIVAPLAGGLLCNPADKYPKYFNQSGIFGMYPYFLPCLICVVFNVISALTCLVFMIETRIPKAGSSMKASIAKGNVTEGGTEVVSKDTDTNQNPIKTLETANVESPTVLKFEGLLELALKTVRSERAPESKNMVKYGVLDSDLSADDLAELRDHDLNGSNGSVVSPLTTTSLSDFDLKSSADTVHIEILKSLDGEAVISREGVMNASTQFVSQLRSESDGELSDEEYSVDSDDDIEDEVCVCCCFPNDIGHSSSARQRTGMLEMNNKVNRYKSLKGPNSGSFSIDSMEEDDDDDGNNEDATTVESSQTGSALDFEETKRSISQNAIRKQDDKVKGIGNVLRLRTVVLITVNYGILAMAFILWDETIPLFLKLDPSQGGFGLSSSDIGLLLSSSGGVMLIFTFIVLPTVAKRSKKWLFRLGICSALPICFAIPLLATLKTFYEASFRTKEGLYLLWILLVSCSVLKNVSACISFTAYVVFLCINLLILHLNLCLRPLCSLLQFFCFPFVSLSVSGYALLYIDMIAFQIPASSCLKSHLI